jgi:hypothetical protein
VSCRIQICIQNMNPNHSQYLNILVITVSSYVVFNKNNFNVILKVTVQNGIPSVLYTKCIGERKIFL